MFVVKCKTDDEFQYLEHKGNLVALCVAEKYPSRDKSDAAIQENGLTGFAKTRRFIEASPRKDS